MQKQGKVVLIKPMRKVKIKEETLMQVWAGLVDSGGKGTGKLTRERSKCN